MTNEMIMAINIALIAFAGVIIGALIGFGGNALLFYWQGKREKEARRLEVIKVKEARRLEAIEMHGYTFKKMSEEQREIFKRNLQKDTTDLDDEGYSFMLGLLRDIKEEQESGQPSDNWPVD